LNCSSASTLAALAIACAWVSTPASHRTISERLLPPVDSLEKVADDNPHGLAEAAAPNAPTPTQPSCVAGRQRPILRV